MNSDNHSQGEHTTQTKEQDLKEQLEAIKIIMSPVASALRKKANGHDVDLQAAFTEARQKLSQEPPSF